MAIASILAWSWPVSFERPVALWLILPIAFFVWALSRRSLAGLSATRRRMAIGTRILVMLLLVAALAGAHRTRSSNDLTVIYMLDVSRSIPQSQKDYAWKFARQTSREIPAADRVGIVAFDGDATIEQLPQKSGPDGAVHIDNLSPPMRPDRTNIAGALSTALAMFPEDAAKRVVLLTDANQTDGDVLAEVQTAAANGVAVDVVPLRYEHRNEVMFEKVAAPAYAHLEDQASLRMVLSSQRDTRGKIRLYHDGRPVALSATGDQSLPVELHAGLNSVSLKTPSLRHTGAHTWEVRYEPDDPADDEIVANNKATAFTNVEGVATVLYLRHAGDARHSISDDQPLIDALAKERIEAVVKTAAEADLDPVSLQQYSAVILGNIPADELTEAQHNALATYVKDLGGGLIMVGGDDSFGAGGWQGSVVEAVMPVRFDVDEIKQIPRGALVVIMHSCEMPQGNYWGVEVALAALKTLSRLDYFGLVDWGYGAGGYQWEVPLQLAADKAGIERRIKRMQNMDMPSFDEPMDMAYRQLRARTDAAQKHVIIISDGDPAAPSPALLNNYRGARITVSTVSIFPHGGGIGNLEAISKATGGKHYNLSRTGDEKRLPQIFIKEAKVVRRPMLREERFTPRLRSSLSDLLAGVGKDFPPLHGYVVTTPRSTADGAEVPLVSDKNDPIMAHWQCGLGRSVAFTSGWWTHWGNDWTSWPGFSKLWAQTVRWCMAQGSAANFDVATRVEGDRGKIVVEAQNKETSYLNFLQLMGNVVQPDGQTRKIALRQTGPGRYEGDFIVGDQGTYLANIQAIKGNERMALIRTGLSIPYSAEYRELRANESLLRQIQGQSPRGRLLDVAPEQANVFAHDLPPTISRQPIWDTLLKWAIVLFLWDVAVRRVAVDPRVLARKAREFISDLAGKFAPGRQAEAVLVDLKSVRDKVRAEKTASAEPAARLGARTEEPAAPVDRSRRFDAVGPKAAPTGDLREALGGAKAAQPPAHRPSSGEATPQESTTSRLLKAKKRAHTDTPSEPGRGSGGDTV